MLHRAITLLLALCLFPYAATAQGPLTTLAEVRAVPHAEAAKELPVEVEGTVIYFDHTHDTTGSEGLVIHDGTAGCWVGSPVPFGQRDKIRPGTRIRVTGHTNGSAYFPDIFKATVEVLGQGDLPVPRRVNASDLFSPEIDSDFVEVGGVVVGMEQGGIAFTVVIEIAGRIFKAEVPPVPDAGQRVAALMQRRVRLQGIVGTISNAQRQLTDRQFLVPSFDHFVPVGAAPEHGTLPLRKIATLLQSDHAQEQLTRVRGVVTQQNRDGLYLRDESGVAFVQVANDPGFPLGSEVEVEGYAAVAPFRPIMRAVRIESLGMTELPPLASLDMTMNVEPRLHNECVSVDCEFLDQTVGAKETILRCRSGDRYFDALLPTWYLPSRPLKTGDQLHLTGIYEVTTTRPNPRIRWADGFRLLLTGPNAIKLVRPAPWWTLQRVLIALGVVATLLMGVFIWNAFLHWRVSVQAATIAAKTEQGVIQEERERIARELHDTLEQELTGMSIQLGNVGSALTADNAPARQGLAIARNMLTHSRAEARATISDLRDSQLLEHSLPEAMQRSFATVAENATAEIHFEVDGDPQPLRGTTANHLLRIAGEAVRNAVRHADAKRIETRLTYDSEGVHLEIDDDGKGFPADQAPPLGHFGLTGMRERAEKLHAEFSIQSGEDFGSKVRVHLPWSSPVARPRNPS